MINRKKITAVFFIISTIVVAHTAVAYGWGRGYGPGFNGPFRFFGEAGWYYPIPGLLFWILIGVAVVFLAGVLLRKRRGNQAMASNRPGALDILKERYARGEISSEEYQSIRNEIQ